MKLEAYKVNRTYTYVLEITDEDIFFLSSSKLNTIFPENLEYHQIGKILHLLSDLAYAIDEA